MTPSEALIRVGGRRRDVVAGGKDATYYAIDRTGVNAVTGVRWNDAGPSRISFSTAPGEDADLPQPHVVNGLVILGSGSGSRGPDPTDPAEIGATLPVDISAFGVAGTRGCESR